MTANPAWLYYLFGSMMLAVAAYSVVLLAATVGTRRPAGWDVAVAHVFMGVAMAGMFVTAWAFGPSGLWELVFAALMVWFLARSVQSVQRFGLHLPHFVIHAAMSLAMLLMYSFPVVARHGSSMAMGGTSSGARLDPGLALVLAFSFFASAVFTLASPTKGASHHGRHAPAYVSEDGTGGGATPAGVVEMLVAMPRLEDASHVVMCVGMGFLLILMI